VSPASQGRPAFGEFSINLADVVLAEDEKGKVVSSGAGSNGWAIHPRSDRSSKVPRNPGPAIESTPSPPVICAKGPDHRAATPSAGGSIRSTRSVSAGAASGANPAYREARKSPNASSPHSIRQGLPAISSAATTS
jgi:hypothetical protein